MPSGLSARLAVEVLVMKLMESLGLMAAGSIPGRPTSPRAAGRKVRPHQRGGAHTLAPFPSQSRAGQPWHAP